VDHAEVGALLLESWQFPEEIVQLVKLHHQPKSYAGDQVDIQYLTTWDTLAGMSKKLPELLTRPVNEINSDFLNNLKKTGWSWETLQEKKKILFESVEQAKQIIKG